MKLFDVTQAIAQRLATSTVLHDYWTRRAGRLPVPVLAEELEKAFIRTLTPQTVSRIYREAHSAWLHRHVDWMALARSLRPGAMAETVSPHRRFSSAQTRPEHALESRSVPALRTRAA